MSKNKLVIAEVLSGCSQAEVAARYGLSKGWVSKLMARYRTEGHAAFEPRSRRPKTNPAATPPEVIEQVVRLRKRLSTTGLDAGPDTIAWHLSQHHAITLSRVTIARILAREGLVTPEPKKRPKASYIRFQAEQPNQIWQSDFIHYRLTHPDGQPGPEVEIITWLDDHSRYALHVSAHLAITSIIVADTFAQAAHLHGYPASTLTDNGLVYTVRLASKSKRGGRTALEAELRRLGIIQKNGKPGRPTTQGKVERFQQTLKKWLRAQPHQPDSLTSLQTLVETFIEEYNQRRPHRSLAHRAVPATAYTTRPKAGPSTDRTHDTHDRVRHDRVDKAGKVTLRYAGHLYSIGIGRTHARTPVILLVRDLNIRIINATTGELYRDLILDPTTRYQGINNPTQRRNP